MRFDGLALHSCWLGMDLTNSIWCTIKMGPREISITLYCVDVLSIPKNHTLVCMIIEHFLKISMDPGKCYTTNSSKLGDIRPLSSPYLMWNGVWGHSGH